MNPPARDRDAERERRRRTFDAVAGRYDRARPGYPDAAFEDIARAVPLGPGTRVLEIGCGTGQATRALAARGCSVTAVELGAQLAAVAREKLARFPNVTVHVADFEAWPLPPAPFDLVCAATSYHWLDPRMRAAKVAAALRPGGVLALLATEHVQGGDPAFYSDVQACYARWTPPAPEPYRLPHENDIVEGPEPPEFAPHFEPADWYRFMWEQSYSSEAYGDLLGTFSDHLLLTPDARAGLVACVATLVRDRYGDRVVRRHLTRLAIRRRRDAVS